MNFKKALSRQAVTLDLEGSTKDAVIEELVDLLDRAGKLRDRKAALKAVLEREKKMSTGMQNGIAIPHGKTESVDALAAAVGIKKDGLDFDSMDGEPSRIFILTVTPANRTGPHIQFLAEISRLLNDAAVRQRLLNAGSDMELIDILTR